LDDGLSIRSNQMAAVRKKRTMKKTKSVSPAHAKNAKGIVRQQLGKKDAPEETETISVRTVVSDRPLAVVKMALGMTISLPRKFEFARLDVGLDLPCEPEKKDEAFKEAEAWCVERTKKQIGKVRAKVNTEKDD
jgi:hypothetical protein